MTIAQVIRKEVITMQEAAFIVQQYIWHRKQQRVLIYISSDMVELMLSSDLQLLCQAALTASVWFLQNGY